MAKKVYLIKIDKRYPNIQSNYPGAKFMDAGGNKYRDLKTAKDRILTSFKNRRYSKPKIYVV